MKSTISKISIITVNYNGRRLLKPCLDSVFGLNYPKSKLEVIVVDNGSTDGSVELVRKKYPRVKLIFNHVNNYCRANNLGIKHSQGRYLSLINNDVRLSKNWLIELLKVAQSDSRIGAVTSKILFPDRRINSTGHVEFSNLYWADRGFKEKDKGQYSKIEEIESLSHCSCLYNRSCLEDVGLLDEDFNMYLEDVDMSLRARQRGWKLFYSPEAICYHRFHGTAKEDLVDFYCERSRLLLVAKHYPEKLSDTLFGKGYFTVTNEFRQRKDIYDILPDVFSKLFKHHNTKILNDNLPDIWRTLKKILNVEKHYLIQHLDSEKQVTKQKDEQLHKFSRDFQQNLEELRHKQTELRQRDIQLQEIDRQLVVKDRYLFELDNQLHQLIQESQQRLSQIEQKDTQLVQRDNEIKQRDIRLQERDNQLQERDSQLSTKDKLLSELDNQLHNLIQESQQRLSQIEQKDNQLIHKEKVIEEIIKDRDSQLAQKVKAVEDITRDRDNQLMQKDKIIEELVKDRDNQLHQLIQESQERLEEIRRKEIVIKEIIEDSQAQLAQKNKVIENIIKDKDNQLLEKNKAIEDITRDRDIRLAQRDEVIEHINKDREIQLGEKDKKIIDLNDEISQIYSSQTYRYIVIPIWKVLSVIKATLNLFGFHFKSINAKSILIIKPYCVSEEEAENALQHIRSDNPKAKITVFKQEKKSISIFKLIKTVICLKTKGFDEAIIIQGKPTYHGYRMAKLTAIGSNARKIEIYFIDSKEKAPFRLMGGDIKSNPSNQVSLGISGIVYSVLSTLLLWSILALFLVFIVLPMKIKKFFQR